VTRYHPIPGLVLAGLALAGPAVAQAPPVSETPVESLSFDESVERARTSSPSVGEAAQAILRAEALLRGSRAVFLPLAYGSVGTTVLNEARGFDDNIVQPRSQTALSMTVSYALIDAVRWAGRSQAGDRVATARAAARETRRHVAVVAAQAYLAVIAAERQRGIAQRNRETAKALEDYARARLDAGQGSRLNHVRAVQQRATADALVQVAELAVRRAQEALGVAVFAEGPVGARGEPSLPPALVREDDAWLLDRPDVQLSRAELRARERIAADAWKSWLPTVTASFTPRYVTPAGLFEPSKSWRAMFLLEVPLFDGSLGAERSAKVADREIARLRLDGVRAEARSEQRTAQEGVRRSEAIVSSTREAAEAAAEALHITEIAYRAGATTNVEVVQAQQAARNGEIEAAVAEDRLRQARLDLLVALGQFPY
jgi:outer membrane protein TolC